VRTYGSTNTPTCTSIKHANNTSAATKLTPACTCHEQKQKNGLESSLNPLLLLSCALFIRFAEGQQVVSTAWLKNWKSFGCAWSTVLHCSIGYESRAGSHSSFASINQRGSNVFVLRKRVERGGDGGGEL